MIRYFALAPAKVNLYLHVGAVKPNGRHALDSLVAFTSIGATDSISAEPSDDLTLRVYGPRAAQTGPLEDNLVLRAAQALKDAGRVKTGAAIGLQKLLPVAAGIGGGSSDAAMALRVLCRLWDVPLDIARAVAPSLGGDVPVAFEAVPSRMRGEGEQVEPVAVWPDFVPVLLVNPNVPCPTGPVFRAFDAASGGAAFHVPAALPAFSSRDVLVRWLAGQRNDLERAAMGLVPEIDDVLTLLGRLRGVELVRMSGSGATCFAICDALATAERASIELKSLRPGWWAAPSRLGAGSVEVDQSD